MYHPLKNSAIKLLAQKGSVTLKLLQMEKIWIIAIMVFLIIAFLFWKLTSGHFKKEYGQKVWNQWGTRLFYWQGTIYTSTGITIAIMYLLKWANVIYF